MFAGLFFGKIDVGLYVRVFPFFFFFVSTLRVVFDSVMVLRRFDGRCVVKNTGFVFFGWELLCCANFSKLHGVLLRFGAV